MKAARRLKIRGPAVGAGDQRAWKQVLGAALVIWLLSRLFLVAVALWAAHFQHSGGGDPLAAWSQWDTNWYLRISRLGYFSERSANFFPLYPGLVGAAALAVRDGAGPVWPDYDPLRLSIALLLANLGTLAALFGVGLLAARELGREFAGRAMRLAVAYPLAFFLGAGYTEGPFLAMASLSLLFARRGEWWRAALAAVLAALTRSAAVALVPALAWEYGRQQGWWRRETWRGGWRQALRLRQAVAAVIVVGAVPAGFALYGFYLWRRFGDPLLFLHTQQLYWHHQFLPPWQTAIEIARHVRQHRAGLTAVDVTAVTGFLLITALVARRLPLAFTLYMVTLVYLTFAAPIPGQTDVIASAGRYLTAAAPAFVGVAWLIGSRRWLEWPGLALGLFLQAQLALIFLRGGPVL